MEESEGNYNDDFVVQHGNCNIDVLLHGKQQSDDNVGYMEVTTPSGNDHRLEHGTEIGVLFNGEKHAENQEGHVEEAAAKGSNHRRDSPVLAVGDVPPF